MNHKLKSMGLALVMAIAVGATAASSASAAAGITVEAGKTITAAQVSGTITGKVVSKHEFSTEAGTVKCEEASNDGTAVALVSTTLRVAATFGKCTLAGAIPVQVTMNGCEFLYTLTNTVVSTDPNTVGATLDIICPSGPIDIHATAAENNCHITVPGSSNVPPLNQNLGGIEFHNKGGSGSSMDILLTIDVNGATYQVHGSECPNAPNTEIKTNGKILGLTTFVSPTSAIGITVH
jgi:hypothetical protein